MIQHLMVSRFRNTELLACYYIRILVLSSLGSYFSIISYFRGFTSFTSMIISHDKAKILDDLAIVN